MKHPPPLSSHCSRAQVHQGKPWRGTQQNKRKGLSCLPNSGSPHIQCFNCSGKNEAFISHSISKKKISCDILIPFCAGAFLEFSPASHLECFVSFAFSWIAYYEPWPTIKNNATVIEWKSSSSGYSGLWVSIQMLTSESPKMLCSWSLCQENKNELWDDSDHLCCPIWFMFLWYIFCKWYDWASLHFS